MLPIKLTSFYLLLLLGIIFPNVTFGQSAPADEENIPYLVTFGSEAETATAPTEPVLKNPSEMFFQLCPPS